MGSHTRDNGPSKVAPKFDLVVDCLGCNVILKPALNLSPNCEDLVVLAFRCCPKYALKGCPKSTPKIVVTTFKELS
jgi:hypothetical protein